MLGRSTFRGTRRTVTPEAAKQRLALVGVGLAPFRAEPPATPDNPESATSDSPESVSPDMGIGPGRHAARPVAAGTRLRATLADRLPPRMRGAMDGTFSGHHLGVLAVVLAAGLAITAWWVLSGRPETQSVPPVSYGSPAPPSASDDAPTARPSTDHGLSPTGAMVIVDVAGKVRDPGIVTLPSGSRVVDALKAAGGARSGVDLADLNLARVLIDGEQLLVGLAPVATPAPTSPTASTSVAPGLVDINTADQAMLETLPGIGPVTAQAILDWRAKNGSFTSVDELLEVDGIGEVTLADIRDLVTI